MTKAACLCYIELLEFYSRKDRKVSNSPTHVSCEKTGLGRSDFLKIPRSPGSQSMAVFLCTIVSSNTW